VRPPEEIAADLEARDDNRARYGHGHDPLSREAAEALRDKFDDRDTWRNCALEEQRAHLKAAADRDALLAVARAAFVMTDGVRGYFQAPSGWIALEDLLDRLPDHLRRQVEQ
jgi:hypothetical protein